MAGGGAIERSDIITNDAFEAPLLWADRFEKVALELKNVASAAAQAGAAFGGGGGAAGGGKPPAKAVDDLARAEERLIKANSDLAKQVAVVNQQIAAKNKQNKEDAKQTLGLVGAYDRLTKELNDARKAYKDLAASGKASNKALQDQEKVVNKLNNRVTTIDKTVGQFQRNVGNYPRTLMAATGALRNFLGAFGIIGGVQLFARAIRDIIKLNKEFEKSLSTLSSITGAVGKDLRFYREEAIKVGAETGKMAKEIVEAYKLVGSQRPELLKDAQALASVTREAIILSQAGEVDVPTAAKALAAALNQFRLPAQDASRIINALGAGAKEGAVEIPDLAEGLLKAGAVARAANVSLEETIALLEILGPAGEVGAEGGTKLRNIILKLQQSSDDINPSIVGLETALDNLAAKELSTAELTKLFRVENINAARAILDNREEVVRLTQAVTGTNVAYEQASTNVNNLEGDIDRFSRTWEKLILTLSKGTGILRQITQAGIGLINIFSSLAESALVKTILQFTLLANPILVVQQGMVKLLALFGKTPDVLEKATAVIKETGSSFDGLKKSINDVNEEIDKALEGNINESSKEYLELLKFKVSQTAEANKRILADEEQTTQARIDASLGLLNANKRLAELTKQTALTNDELTTEQRILIHEKYLDEISRAEEQSANERKRILLALSEFERTVRANVHDRRLKESTDAFAKEVEAFNQQKEFMTGIEERFSERLVDDAKKRNERLKEEEKKRTEDYLAEQEKRRAIEDAAINLGQTIFFGALDNRQEKLAIESEQLEDRREKELEAAGDDERKKLAINKKFDREQAKIRQKQATAQKLGALFDIAINTAVGITSALRMFPPNPFLAGIIAATGAAQALLVAARPVPKFFKGSDSTPSTFIAGDAPGGGSSTELVSKNGKTMLVDRPTLFTGMAGAMVTPESKATEILGTLEDARLRPRYMSSLTDNMPVIGQIMEMHLMETNALLRKIESKPVPSWAMDKHGFREFIMNGLSKTEYINKRFGSWS